MGLTLRPLGKKLWETLTPQNEEAIRRSQASITNANQRINQLGNRSKGVLAAPHQRQQFTHQNQAPRFSLAQAYKQSWEDPTVARDATVGTLRGLARIPETASRSWVELTGGQPQSAPSATDPVRRLLYGSEPIQTYQKRAEGIHKSSSAPGGLPTVSPVVAGIGLAGMDILPGGKAKPRGASPPRPKVTAKSPPTPVKPAGQGVTPAQTHAELNQAVKDQQTKYAVSAPQKTKDAVLRAYDPAFVARQIDKATAKSRGVKYRELPASERLEHLYDVSRNSRQQAEEILKSPTRTGESGAGLLQRYRGKDELEFNNYANAKFDLEFRAKHKNKPIQKGVSNEKLSSLVKDYEARNPRAVADLQTMKALNDEAVDRLVASGAFSKADGDFVKSFYENAVPLSRVTPDDLKRVEVGAKPVGSIGKQTVVQRLVGNSDTPLDNTFQPLLNRLTKAVSQSNRASLAQAYLRRVQEGVAPGELIVGAGNKATRQAIRGDLKTVARSTRFFSKKLGLTNRQAKKLQTEISNLNKSGMKVRLKNTKEPNLAGKLVDPTAKVSPNEMRSIVEDLVRLDPTGINAIKKKIAVREPKLAAKLDEVLKYQDEIASNKALKQDLKQTIVQFGDESPTGRQTISGLVDGEKFQLEVPPEIARLMQGLDEKQLDGLLKVGYGINKVFQTAWTGFLQPVFSLFSYALFDPAASIVISNQGFKTFRPAAVAQMFRSFKSSNEFSQALRQNGYMPPGGSMLARDPTLNAAKIAASDSVLGKIKFNISHPKEMLEALDVVGGKLANSSRERIAKAHYVAAKKAGATEKQAVAEAVYAANNVLPNYQRTSALVKQMNAFIPYSGASVAGTRSLLGALRNNPRAWGKLGAVAVAPPVAAVAYSLGSESGEAYYQDMEQSGKGYVLDNNINIVLPGARKDPKTGEWSGVWKIPVAPELRAINKTVWRGAAAHISDNNYGADPQTVALSIFDTMTGGMRGQSNPAINTAIIAGLGLDPRSLEPLVKGDLQYEDKKDQAFDTTTAAGKGVSKLTGNKISPIQGDEILSQFSLAGQLLQNREGNPLKTVVASVRGRVYGAYGEKDGAKFFKEFDRLMSETKLDPDDRKTILALHSKDPQPGILDSTEKATAYLNRPAVLEFDRKLDQWNRSQGKPGNPIFDLSDDRLNRLLVYRHGKMLNAGKQAYDKNGNPLFMALGLDEPWYDDLRAKEDAFYKSLPKKEGAPAAPESFSGHPRLEKPAGLEVVEDVYYKLPKGTGERSRFLRAHPELLAWWEASDGFTDAERAAIGLKVYGEDGSSSYGTSGSANTSFAFGKGKPSVGSAYKYAVSLNAAGKPSRPKISVAGAKGKAKAKKKIAKPKVSIRKA